MRRKLIYRLLRFALSGDEANLDVFKRTGAEEWAWIYNMLSMHGVAPLVSSAVERMPEDVRPPKDVLLKLIAVNVSSKKNYVKLGSLKSKVETILKESGIKCLLLKGFSLAEYYPRPELRKFLDMDLYAPDRAVDVDEAFRAKGVKVDADFYKHSHMTLGGVLVENHHCLLDTRGRKRMAGFDADLKAMALARLEKCDGPGLYYPDARFSLIFNLHHAMSHFIYEGISFKFLVDWVLFLRCEKELLSGEQTAEDLRRHGLLKFAAVMSEVSVRHLGLSVEDVPACVRAEMADLKDSVVQRFVDDLFRPYERSHMNSLLAERLNNVRRIIKASWKPKEFLGQSAVGFVWDKLVPILMGRKYEAD